MNRIRLWPAALLGLAAACPALPAQSAGAPQASPAIPPGPGLTKELDAAAGPATDMQENVEILRRLLDKAFAETYGFNSHKWGQQPPLFSTTNLDQTQAQAGQAWRNVAAHEAPRTEGVYLKGYGVVYTATLPYPGFDPVAGTSANPTDKAPPSDWDRVRKELHGETAGQQTRTVPGHKPLADVILKVLADNGQHFSGLGDGERITTAVTFRGAASCNNCHENPWKGQTGQQLPIEFYQLNNVPTETPGAAAPTHGAPSYVTDARNAALLGDLHMKQGKPQEAIQAYQKAADQLTQMIAHQEKTEIGLTQNDVPALLTAIDLCNKLADAYVQSGQQDAGSGMLKKAGDLAKQAQKLTGAPVPTNPPPALATLPGKLVVSATKKQLDDVGSGKMTFEEFRKAATVDYVKPSEPGADKK
jgi:tetratricopeptide (TPR) repeat protein